MSFSHTPPKELRLGAETSGGALVSCGVDTLRKGMGEMPLFSSDHPPILPLILGEKPVPGGIGVL